MFGLKGCKIKERLMPHDWSPPPDWIRVSARAALHFARGALGVGEPFTVESVLGTTFTGEVVEATRFGPYDAVIPSVSGNSYITGRGEFLIDPENPLRHGFIPR
jgi:trans-L-3-hydroxyproline dehydratase